MVKRVKKRKVSKKTKDTKEYTKRYSTESKAQDAAQRLRKKGYKARVSKETEKRDSSSTV